MQLSYAQNLEDYHLDLVLGDRAQGTYVDVGGGHPVADNVSFWFYLKGWHGLVVEPQEALAGIYAGVRPRDCTVSCLAGRTDAEADFHVVDRLHGFSTTVHEYAAGAARFGAGYTTVRRPVRTLTSLCADAGLARIDFLKIDVEGAEADVLAGMDFERWRPAIVVVEALAPGSMADAWGAWEPDLIAAGYRFAFFDRLNRFYVADEAAELARRLPADPTPRDRVRHLSEYGRAAERTDHPDHTLTTLLQAGLLAALPTLEPALIERLIVLGLQATGRPPYPEGGADKLLGTAELPRARTPAADLAGLIQTDELRAALGRIACRYDGGLPEG